MTKIERAQTLRAAAQNMEMVDITSGVDCCEALDAGDFLPGFGDAYEAYIAATAAVRKAAMLMARAAEAALLDADPSTGDGMN